MELFIVCFIIGVIGYFTKVGGYKDENGKIWKHNINKRGLHGVYAIPK
nr:MAG: hypothetical protein [Bacteriophage sp.]